MRTPAGGAMDRLDRGEIGFVVFLVVAMHRDGGAFALMEGRQPDVVRGDGAELDREEDFQIVVLDLADDLAKRLRSFFAGQVIFHFVEAHAALGGERLVGIVHALFGFHVAEELLQDPAPGGRRPAQPLFQHFQFFERVVVGLRRDRRFRLVGDVVGNAERHAGEGDVIEFEDVVLAPELRRFLQHVVDGHDPGAALELVERAGLQLHLGDDAKRADGDAGGLKEVRIVVGVAVDGFAVGRHQTQARHEGRERADIGAGAMRGGGNGARDGLLVDVGHVVERKAALGKARAQCAEARAAHDGGFVGAGIAADDTAHPVEGEDRAGGGNDGREGMSGAHSPQGRGARFQQAGQFFRTGGRGAAFGRAALTARPVVPGERFLLRLGEGAGDGARQGARRGKRGDARGLKHEMAAREFHCFVSSVSFGAGAAMKRVSAMKSSREHSMHWPSGGMPLKPFRM